MALPIDIEAHFARKAEEFDRINKVRRYALDQVVTEIQSSKLPIIIEGIIDGGETFQIPNDAAIKAAKEPKSIEPEALGRDLRQEVQARTGPTAPAWLKRMWRGTEIKFVLPLGFFSVIIPIKEAVGVEEQK